MLGALIRLHTASKHPGLRNAHDYFEIAQKCPICTDLSSSKP